MAKMITDSSNYSAIAEAIRAKGVEGNFKPTEMAEAISAIVAGGGGSVEYVPTEKEIIPEYIGTKFVFTFLTYSYTQNLELIYTFKEPTTKPYYLNCMTDVGIGTDKKIYFDGVASSSDTLNPLGYSKSSLGVTIPEGTTTVKIAFSCYSTDYTHTVGFYISETRIESGSQVSDYYAVWEAESPVDFSLFDDISYTQVDAAKVQIQPIEDRTPEQTVILVQGYLKVSVDGTEYTIYEAEGGTY